MPNRKWYPGGGSISQYSASGCSETATCANGYGSGNRGVMVTTRHISMSVSTSVGTGWTLGLVLDSAGP